MARLILLWALLLPAIFCYAYDNCYRASLLNSVLQRYHIEPRQVNDSLSSALFDGVLKTLDPRGTVFTRIEIQKLEAFRYKLDEELLEKRCSFLDKLTESYRLCLQRADTIAGSVLSKPLNFSEKDTGTFSYRRSPNFAANRLELERTWIRFYKTRWLTILSSTADSTAKKPVESEWREKMKQREQKDIRKLLAENLEEIVAMAYLHSLSTCFDPHSMFFNSNKYTNWMNHLTVKTETFGIVWAENDKGEVEVSRLLPGSFAWKCNQLHKGDVLMKVKEGVTEILDATIQEADDIMESLDEYSGKKMNVVVRKNSGEMVEVALVKQTISLDEDRLHSYLIDGEQKVGYITLPDFYTDADRRGSQGCANDVAKEILKLQKENIQGLIIDLRNNGGGSMQEAMELAGIFIDEGPLFYTKENDGKVHVMKDPNRGTIYNGDMLVLVNGFSASASELLAGVLQDYNRAVIAGSRTYGKATMQEILPLDTSGLSRKIYEDRTGLGYIKVTGGKLYRLGGGSHQKTGVIPDICIPDIYAKNPWREEYEPNALKADSVSKRAAFTPGTALPLKELVAKSAQRQSTSSRYSRITGLADSIYSLPKGGLKIALQEKDYRAFTQNYRNLYQSLQKASTDSLNALPVRSVSFDEQLLKADEYRNNLFNDALKNIRDDIYVQEAYNIIKDLITSHKH